MPFKFETVGDFHGFHQYMPASMNGRTGVINAAGEVVVPFDYVLVRIWADYGVAMVRCDNWTYSGIVEFYTGRVIVPFGLYHSIDFHGNRLAQARHTYASPGYRHSRWGFIDIVTGEVVVPLIYSAARNFSEGLSAVRYNGLWGFIDETGQLVIPHIYDNVGIDGFIDGTVAVNRDGWGIIDTTGAYILPPTHNGIYRWWDGQMVDTGEFAVFSTIVTRNVLQARFYGVLNMQTGEEIIPAVHRGWFYAGEGIMLMRKGDFHNNDFQNHDENILINLNTGQQFPFPFAIGDDIEISGPMPPRFYNGISSVYIIDEHWGRIYGIADNQGNVILPPNYPWMYRLPGGTFAVSTDEWRMGIVDESGQVVLPLIYCYIEFVLGGRDPSHDITAIRMGGEWVEAESDFAHPNWVLKNALWGFADANGHLAVPAVLDFIYVKTMGHRTAAVQTSDGLWGLIRIH